MSDPTNTPKEPHSKFTSNSTAETLSAAAQELPIELVLRILEFLALATRDSSQVHTVSLSLVSRGVRACVLPLIYKVLILKVVLPARDIVGWDGRTYDHAATAYLSWLLCNPSATPRRHIRHLVFDHPSSFYARNIRPNYGGSPGDTSTEPHQWELDSLVTFPSDAVQLHLAGIRARVVHWLSVGTPETRYELLSARARAMGEALRDQDPLARNCVRFWTDTTTTEANKVPWTGVLQYQEIDSEHGIDGRIATPDMQGVHVFIDIGAQDGFGCMSRELMNEIASVLVADPDLAYRVVLVCAPDASDAALGDVARMVHAEPEWVPIGLLSRIWVTRSSWPDRKLMMSDSKLALVRVIELGLDPWDIGRQLSSYF